jgi:hypothetical protein
MTDEQKRNDMIEQLKKIQQALFWVDRGSESDKRKAWTAVDRLLKQAHYTAEAHSYGR